MMNHNAIERAPSSQTAAQIPQSGDLKNSHRRAVILAGGEGTRLRSLTRAIVGDERPKQFCPILGDETLLDQTRNRVALVVAPQQTLFVLTRTHEQFYRSHLRDVPSDQLVVQPKNQGTAPAILYSLMRLSKVDPFSTVAFFPSDHYFSDDAGFMSYVESAFEATHAGDDKVILLGIQPHGPETEYGWIEPLASELTSDAMSWVRRFWEKPTDEVARGLLDTGCLWNSFVMVGSVSAFLKMIRRALPDLWNSFKSIERVLNTTEESQALEKLYTRIPEINFSQSVLSKRPGNLAVLPVVGLKWNDLGKPQRVLSTLADIGVESKSDLWRSPAVLSNAVAA
ncbi:MAG: sugar phosphate nucleotidyltransferase [Acidobacteriota bacterium]